MAINHQHIRVCKFLLQAKADPFLSDFTQWLVRRQRILNQN